MMKKKNWISVAVVLALVLCAGPLFAGGAQEEEKEDSSKINITWLGFWEGDVGNETLDALEAKFMEENPDITISRESVPFGQFYDKLVILAKANDLPDVVAMNGSWIPSFAEMGAIESLEKRMVDDNIKEKMAFLDTYMGQQWKVDIYGGPILTFCNKGMFEEAGLDYPTTWEEYIEVSRKLTDPSKGKYATAIEMSMEANSGLFYWYWPLLFSAGGRATDDQGNLIYNQKPGVQALEFLSTLVNENLVLPGTPSNTETEKRNGFASEILAMYNEGPWGPGVLSSLGVDFEYEVIPWIEGPGSGGTIAAGSGLSMSANSEHKEAAWKFIKFLTVGEGNKIWVEKTNNLSAYKPHLDMDYIQKDPNLPVFAKQLARPGNSGVPIVQNNAEWIRVLINAIQEHLTGRKTAQEALDDVVEQFMAAQ